MPTWTDAYIEALTKEAERQIAIELAPFFSRETLAVTSGTPTYTLPNYLREIQSIRWKGTEIHPLHQDEASRLSFKYLTESGEPRFYLRSPEDFQIIRFMPVPNETITAAADDDVLDSTVIEDKVVISFYREPDTSGSLLSLPDFIGRRTIKNYVLMRAFAKEGKGQKLEAAAYYEEKHKAQMDSYKALRTRYWSSKKKSLQPTYGARTYSRFPQLAPDFMVTPLILKHNIGELFEDLSSNWNDDVNLVLS